MAVAAAWWMLNRSYSALVIDDCLEQAECFARLLEAMGHRATFVIHPLDALDTADAIRPDVVFVDLDMPEIDGWALARMLRKRFGAIRLVAVSGLDPASRDGFDACLVKPIGLDALRKLLAAETETL
jgi:CheY-like chemotaxis protein